MFIFSLIVGLIVLGLLPALYLGFNAWLQRELSVQRELGNCIATPFGFERQNFLVYRMDSVTIQCPDQSIQIHSPLLRIQLGMLDGTADVFLSIGSVRYEQLSVSDSTPADSNLTSAANYAFPRYNIPIHYKLDVGSVWARKDSLQINAWQVQLESTGSQSTGLKITSLTTNLFDHPISLQSHLNWQADSLASELFIRGGTKDSIRIVSKGHYKDIRQQSANLFVFVNDPLKWYEYTLPSPLPSLATISLQAAIQTDTNLLNSKYQGKLQFTNSTNFPFQWSHNDLTFSGTGKQMQLGLLQTNKKTNGSISLNGTLVAQSPVQLSVAGYIDNIALFPDNPALPADLRLHSLQIQNSLLTIQATTLAGSDVFLKINLGSQSPFLQAQGDLAPHEPWVTWWTKGNVQPASRIAAQVTYDKNIWNGELQTSIQNAYGARADSFYAVVQITDSQVLIPLAQIHNQNTLYTVNGSVNISNPAPVIQFTAQEAQTGIVQLFLIPDQSISVSASNINLSALPIQDTLLPDFVNGILSANFTHSFLDTMGHFVFSLQHQYQNYPVTLQGDVYIAGDSAHVQELLVERNNNSLTATADFKPIFTNPGLHSLQNANINIKHIDLPLIGSALLDSLFTSGSLYGTIVYNRLSGFNSQIRGENISFKQLDSTFMNIPRLHLDAVANKAMLNARLKLGALGEWDSEIALNFLNPMDSSRSVSGAIVTDHGGVILLNAPSQKNLQQKVSISTEGAFLFPGGNGQISKSNLQIHLTLDSSRTLQGLSAQISANQLLLKPGPTIPELPVILNGSLQNGLLQLNQIQITNAQKDTLNANFTFDIAKGSIEKLHFNTDYFRFAFQEDMLLTFTKMNAKTHIDSSNIIFTLDVPNIELLFKDNMFGTINSNISGSLKYNIPTAGTKQSALHAISGAFDIQSFQYNNTFNIDPTNLNSLFKTNPKAPKSPSRSAQASEGTPILLDISIRDNTQSSMLLKSDLFTVPVTTNMQISGNTNNPILTGDISAIQEGKFMIKGVVDMQIPNLHLSWRNNTLQEGNLEVNATTSLPYCIDPDAEMCPVELNVVGKLGSPQLQTFGNCNRELTSAELYSSLLVLGCIVPEQSDDQNSDDLNAAFNKLAGFGLTTFMNSLYGQVTGSSTKIVDNVEVRWDALSFNSLTNADSNFFKIPFNLSKDLKLTLGYGWGTGVNPRFEDYREIGLDYFLRVFDENNKEQNPNMLSPEMSLSGNILQKNYSTDVASEDELRALEFNFGAKFRYGYWDLCVFGFGDCKASKEEPK